MQPLRTFRTRPTDLEPIERASRDELCSVQLERLKEAVAHAYSNVPHYRGSFDVAGARPDDLRALEDLRKFPFQTKEHLRQQYPFGMFAVGRERIARIRTSSNRHDSARLAGCSREPVDAARACLRWRAGSERFDGATDCLIAERQQQHRCGGRGGRHQHDCPEQAARIT